MNWTYTVTTDGTDGMAGWIGAAYLLVVAVRTRRSVVEALRALRRAKPAGHNRITLTIGQPPTRRDARVQQRRDQTRRKPCTPLPQIPYRPQS